MARRLNTQARARRRLLSASLLAVAALYGLAEAQNGDPTTVPNVPIDENRDGRVTITFSPSSNYMPTQHGQKLNEEDLSAFGVRFSPALVVQECGENLNYPTQCRLPSSKQDAYAASVQGNSVTLFFSPPAAGLSLEMLPVSRSDKGSARLELYDAEENIIGSNEITISQPGVRWSSIRAVAEGQNANAIDFAVLSLDGQTSAVSLDTITIIRQVDRKGDVLVASAAQLPVLNATGAVRDTIKTIATDKKITPLPLRDMIAEAQARRKQSGKAPYQVSPDEIKRAIASKDRTKRPGAVPVRLTVDWDAARLFAQKQRDLGRVPLFAPDNNKLEGIGIPVLIPRKATRDPIIAQTPDKYNAIWSEGDKTIRVKGMRLVQIRDPEKMQLRGMERLEVFETEGGLQANFSLFGISYSVYAECDAYNDGEYTCFDDSSFKAELDDLLLILPASQQGE